MTNNTRTLTEILADFQKGHTKVAEDEGYSNIVPADEAAEDAAPEAACEDGEACDVPEEDYEADGEGVTATDLTDAAEAVKEDEDQTVDAAKELREIADEYIDAHNDALAKEASLFGEIFAKSAMMTMQADNAMQEAYNKTASLIEEDENVFNKIAEDAYDAVNSAIATGEVPPAEELPEWLQNTVENNSDAIASQTDNISTLVDSYVGGGDAAPVAVEAPAEEAEDAPEEELGTEDNPIDLTPEEAEDIPDEVVDDTVKEAYLKTAEALAEGSDPRLEEEVDDSTEVEEEGDEEEGSDEDVSGDDVYEDEPWMVAKTAEEAYDKAVEALDEVTGDAPSVAEDEEKQEQDEEVPQEDEDAEDEAVEEAAEDAAEEVAEDEAEDEAAEEEAEDEAEDEAAEEVADELAEKTAEEAYDAANDALAAAAADAVPEEDPNAPKDAGDMPPWLQKAMVTNATALKEQSDTLNELASSYASPAPNPQAVAGEAYDAANAAMQGGAPAPNPQDVAGQAYDATNAAIQGGQPPMDPAMMQGGQPPMAAPMQPQPGGMM